MPVISGVTNTPDYDSYDFDNIVPVSQQLFSPKQTKSNIPSQSSKVTYEEEDPDLSLPEIGSANLIGIAGLTGSGKTNLLLHILKDPKNHRFRDYKIICPQGTSEQPFYQGFPRKCFVQPTNTELDNLVEEQKLRYKKDKSTALWIFDDILGSEMTKGKSIVSLATSCRHSGVICIYLIQSLAKLDTTLRDSMAQLYITQIKNHELGHASKMVTVLGSEGRSLTPKEVEERLRHHEVDKWSIKKLHCQECLPMEVFHLEPIKYKIYFEL